MTAKMAARLTAELAGLGGSEQASQLSTSERGALLEHIKAERMNTPKNSVNAVKHQRLDDAQAVLLRVRSRPMTKSVRIGSVVYDMPDAANPLPESSAPGAVRKAQPQLGVDLGRPDVPEVTRVAGRMVDPLNRVWGEPLTKAGAPQPPPGFAPIPNSSHGGYRKMGAGGWEYWYPDGGGTANPTPKNAPKAQPGSKPDPVNALQQQAAEHAEHAQKHEDAAMDPHTHQDVSWLHHQASVHHRMASEHAFHAASALSASQTFMGHHAKRAHDMHADHSRMVDVYRKKAKEFESKIAAQSQGESKTAPVKKSINDLIKIGYREGEPPTTTLVFKTTR